MTAGFIVESDKLPVIGTVTRKLAIGLRELLALAIITILVIICIILAVLLSKAKSSAHKSSPTAAAQTGSKNQCFDKLCLDSMSHVLADMNQNQQPCDNFYQYACGQYVSSHNVNKDKKSSALLDISNKNMARIENLLLYDKTYQWSSEKKAKDFYKSCMDDYTTERLRGVPFIKRVLPLLGGAYFLNTWNSSTFNLLNTLNKVQSDLGVNAFWLFRVERDVTNNLQDRIIEVMVIVLIATLSGAITLVNMIRIVLFFCILRLYGVGHMVKDHSDSERGNPLPPHGLLFPINNKGSFICTIPQTG